MICLRDASIKLNIYVCLTLGHCTPTALRACLRLQSLIATKIGLSPLQFRPEMGLHTAHPVLDPRPMGTVSRRIRTYHRRRLGWVSSRFSPHSLVSALALPDASDPQLRNYAQSSCIECSTT